MNFCKSITKSFIISTVFGAALLAQSTVATAQEEFPADNGLFGYHPEYRESESHPFRIASYLLHPFGWVIREGITRPLSFLISSNPVTTSIFGYREPHDYRVGECFSTDGTIPDCRALSPYNYAGSEYLATDFGGNTGSTSNSLVTDAGVSSPAAGGQVAAVGGEVLYFPDVNFDFGRHGLTDLGLGRVNQIAALLKEKQGLRLVLQGHTDFKGSDQANEKLGLNRAEAVKRALADLGVPADRIATVTFGKSQPLLGEETDWARAVNRRVSVAAGS